MKYEFFEAYNALFNNIIIRLNTSLKVKVKAINACQEAMKKEINDFSDDQEDYEYEMKIPKDFKLQVISLQ